MTPSASHQTVQIARGRHKSPAGRACVMELASMLAGEPFSDSPQSVCSVIGSFLRPYNDGLGAERRQDLYGVAAKIVGTSADRKVRRARARLLRERLAGGISGWRAAVVRLNLGNYAGAECARMLLRGAGHDAAMRLVDELVALGPRAGTSDDRPDQARPRRIVERAPVAG